jgi:hypothetical protein
LHHLVRDRPQDRELVRTSIDLRQSAQAGDKKQQRQQQVTKHEKFPIQPIVRQSSFKQPYGTRYTPRFILMRLISGRKMFQGNPWNIIAGMPRYRLSSLDQPRPAL